MRFWLTLLSALVVSLTAVAQDDPYAKVKEGDIMSGKIGPGDSCLEFCPYKHICRKEEVEDD